MIRTAFVFDGYDEEQGGWELPAALEELEKLGFVGDNAIQVVTVGNSVWGIIKSDPRIDLLIVDYGGMYTTGNTATPHMQVWHACNWVDKHPGAMLVVWTGFTAQMYKRELENEFPSTANNIVVRYTDKLPEANAKLQTWFGIKQEEV